MTPPIINLDDLKYEHFGIGDTCTAEQPSISTGICAREFGYGVIRLQPGRFDAWAGDPSDRSNPDNVIRLANPKDAAGYRDGEAA